MFWQQQTPVRKYRISFALPGSVGLYGLAVGALLLFSLALHMVLIAQGWPMTNSDEGTMGLMALHIAYHGVHPTFFYGQNYMGSWEAFVAAGLFRLFGPSLFALRLGTLCMFALFLLALYLLSRLLFSRTWTLITLLLAGTGSGFMMAQEMRAIGGYAETLCFCTVLALCATWLALTYRPGMKSGAPSRRLLVYLLWGLLAGVALWTDMLIIPAIIASGLLLLLVCWRELLRPFCLSCVLVGLLVGAFPLIFYNLHALPGQDTLSVLRGLDGTPQEVFQGTAPSSEVRNTFQVSLPLMTGEPFCPVTEISFLGPTSPDTQSCTLARSSWSALYLGLFILAALLTGSALRSLWRQRTRRQDESAWQRDLRIQLARLALLFSAALSMLLYTFSKGPLTGPGLHARYLICLLTATPIVYWPLWQGLQRARSLPLVRARLLQGLCLCGLAYFVILSLLGSLLAFTEVPAAQALNRQDSTLISVLEHLEVRHIYTDYWTCDKIAFESDERITCVSITDGLQISLRYTRYTPYIAQVRADPGAAYVLPMNKAIFTPFNTFVNDPDPPTSMLPFNLRINYIRLVTDGYVIYLPHAPALLVKRA
jgi:4-amino-4-deoxy-L-arabinose transferase-like glycosyltransferase